MPEEVRDQLLRVQPTLVLSSLHVVLVDSHWLYRSRRRVLHWQVQLARPRRRARLSLRPNKGPRSSKHVPSDRTHMSSTHLPLKQNRTIAPGLSLPPLRTFDELLTRLFQVLERAVLQRTRFDPEGRRGAQFDDG